MIDTPSQSATPAQRLGRDYHRLFAASTISNLGDGVFLVALPLLAARLTRDAVSISLVTAAIALPWLIFSLPVGTLVDRVDRRRVLLVADTARAVVVAAIAIAAATGEVQIWMLWVAGLFLGIAEVCFDNASQALLPAIVPSELLEKANGRRYAGEIAANIFVGSPLGSILFAAAVWLPFALDAASFVLAVLLVTSIGGLHRVARPETTRTTSLAAETREGLSWLWRHRLLRTMAISVGLSNLAFHMAQAVFVLFALERLDISVRAYGFVLAIMGIGAIGGALVGARVSARVGQSFAILASLAMWVVSMAGTGLVVVTWFVVLMAFLQSVAATIWNVVTVSLRQQIVPPELFGRVNSVYRWFGWGTLPIGAVLGGQVARLFGLRAPYLFGAGILFVAFLIALRGVSANAIAASKDAASTAPLADDTPLTLQRDDVFD